MQRRILTLAVAAVLCSTLTMSQTTLTTIGGPSTETTHYGPGSYVVSGARVSMFGQVFFDSLATLTIPAGTTIIGDSLLTGSNKGASLIMRRGAKLIAIGTPTNPIVFTSRKPQGQQAPGDWGGVILLGSAPTNQAAPIIEGGIIGADAVYGGTDPHDNSGTLQYVRIEFAGYRYQLNNEINGLTFGGVGDGTVVDHVEVAYAYDDSFEWFGGTVNCKYLVAFGGTDDDFDTDFGFSGRLQFCFGYRDPFIWDPTGESNGFESDNNNNGGGNGYSTDAPRTSVKMCNMTLVGPRRATSVSLVPGNRFQYGVVERRATRHDIYNTINVGFPGGYSLRDIDTYNSTQDGTKETRGLSLASNADAGFLVVDYRLNNAAVAPGPVSTWLQTVGYKNVGTDVAHQPDDMGLANMSNFTSPDPRPLSGLSVNDTVWAGTLVASDPLVTKVGYRGAFDPAVPMNAQWTAGWTKFDYSNNGTSSKPVYGAGGGWNLVSVSRGLSDFHADAAFPGHQPGVYSYDFPSGVNPLTSNPSFVRIDTLPSPGGVTKSGWGYWTLWNPTPASFSQTGSFLPGAGQTLPAMPTKAAGGFRWVMFSCGTTPTDRFSLAEGSAVHNERFELGTLWYFDATSGLYVNVPFTIESPTSTCRVTAPNQLQPGVGYFIFVNGGTSGASSVIAAGQ